MGIIAIGIVLQLIVAPATAAGFKGPFRRIGSAVVVEIIFSNRSRFKLPVEVYDRRRGVHGRDVFFVGATGHPEATGYAQTKNSLLD